MSFASEPIFVWLSQYAYQPELVYLAVFGMMMASGFGFPLPEEVTIVSVGLLAYMGNHPQHFPPPYPGAPVVEGAQAAIVTFASVVIADLTVFMIGRKFGRRLIQVPLVARVFTPKIMERIDRWLRKYGVMAAFLFRFTPGIRFPAHIIMGMSQFPISRFAMVDGLAALISVPTQIMLIYHFGEPILRALAKFKTVFFIVAASLLLIWIARRLLLPQARAA